MDGASGQIDQMAQEVAEQAPLSGAVLCDSQMRLIARRWPALAERLHAAPMPALALELVQGNVTTLSVAGIQMGSRYAPEQEALLQAAHLPEAETLHLYGMGLGELPRLLLSSRPELRRLEVRILNAGLFVLLLQIVDHSAWLGDERTHLSLAGDEDEVRLPFFAHPADLCLCDDGAARIRDRLVSELNLPYARRTFRADNPLWAERLQQNLPLLREDHDVAELFGQAAGREAFIIGTGPTLEQHLDRIAAIARQKERPLLIAADTALAPLARVGVRPDFAVACDYRIDVHHLQAGAAHKEIALVYAPLIAGEVLRSWQGARYAMYSKSPIYEQVRKRCAKGNLFEGGSVIHPAIDLAARMGCTALTLFGTDFCFPNGKTHAHWPAGSLRADIGAAQHWVLNCRGERVVTNPNFAGYLVELERYIKHHPELRFFQTSYDSARIAGCAEHAEFMQ